MKELFRIGVVNIDVSHPKAFSELFRQAGRARYTAVYNEGFRDSREVEGFRRMAGLDTICGSLEELVDNCDVGFIQACNWDKHLPHALAFLQRGKPVFIDKPMVGNIRDCERLLELEKNGGVIMGASSVRYCEEITRFIDLPVQERGEVLHVSATVGVDEFNYAIHAVEGVCALIQSKPLSVRHIGVSQRGGQSCVTLFIFFENGATATCQCVSDRFLLFHMTVLTTKQDFCMTLDNSRLYAPMLSEICNKLEGKPNRLACVEELTWPIRILLGGKLSREKNGAEISLWDPELETVSFDGYAFEKQYATVAKPMYL